MLHFQGVHSIDRPLHSVVVTIGNFDGVHLGHQAILSTARSKAKNLGGTLVAMTFRPHPRAALHPGQPLGLLTDYDEKIEIMGELGACAPDIVIEEPFSREFSSQGAEGFFKELLIRKLSAREIVVGYDFAFGRERTGDQATLKALCQEAGVDLTVVQPQRLDGEVVSSSRIRQHLLSGEVAEAAKLLGRPFRYRGVVERGEGRGRKIGFPTANVSSPDPQGLHGKLLLPFGVYATLACWNNRVLPSVTNFGVRPTFHSGNIPLIETHVLDLQEDLYGCNFEVRFVERIRAEKKFSGVDALKTQIAQDVSRARTVLKTPTTF